MPKAVTTKNEVKMKEYLRKQKNNDPKPNIKTRKSNKSGSSTG